MNFSKTAKRSVLSCSNLNLLVLASEWSKYKDDGFKKTDIILVLLQGIQASSENKCLSAFTIQQKLGKIDARIEKCFVDRAEEASTDLSCFMSLFEQFPSLICSDEDSRQTLLDRDCKNSVFGIFIRQCVQEYKRLTFSQLTRLHSKWRKSLEKITEPSLESSEHPATANVAFKEHDFTSALQKMMVQEEGVQLRGCGDGQCVATDNTQLGAEALQLAQLHGAFGHKVEGVFALHEAIRLAQQRNNPLLLEHALGWLHKLQPMDKEESLIILSRYTKNAEELKLPMLGMWGPLQQAKAHVTSGQDPKRVMEILMSSESDFSCIYSDKAKKLSQRSSMLAVQGATLEYYGHKLAGVFYSQLLCHMMSCDLSHDPEREESFALSLCSIAKHLLGIGNFENSVALLNCAKQHFKGSTAPLKILYQCTEEVSFDRALQIGDLSTSKRHLSNLVTFDANSAEYRSSLLAKEEGDLQRAFEMTHTLVKRLQLSGGRHTDLLPSCHLLLGDILSSQRSPSVALPHVMACLSYCEEHHLPTYSSKLSLALLQLQLGAPMDCLDQVKGCLLHCHTHGGLLYIAKAYFLLAQSILMTKKTKAGLDKQGVLEVLPYLDLSLNFYNKCSALSQVKQVQTLQAYLYDHVGNSTERDRLSKLLLK